jgi:hypothetical protein
MANVSPMDRLTTDHAALERAVAMYRSASAENFRGVDSMLANGTPWSEVAEYASYHCQVRNLGLPPWQPAPCKIDDIAAALKVQDPQRAIARLRCSCSGCYGIIYHGSSLIRSRPAKRPRPNNDEPQDERPR